jgi:ubiquinone/menaquinone biosynthesis C-methylase UbiE
MRTAVHRKSNCYRSAALLIAAAVLIGSALARAIESEIDHLVELLQLKPGSVVADVGAGSGEVSIAIAKRVGPQGKVYSTEIDPNRLDKIRSLVQKEAASNIIPIAGTVHDTDLPPDCCNAIFLRQVYHHLTDPLGMDRSLYRVMRPGARLAIIDFDPSQLPGQPAPPGVPANRGGHGVPEKIVEAELTRTGFVLIKTMEWPINITIHHYCMLFIKPRLPQPVADSNIENAASVLRASTGTCQATSQLLLWASTALSYIVSRSTAEL